MASRFIGGKLAHDIVASLLRSKSTGINGARWGDIRITKTPLDAEARWLRGDPRLHDLTS
jgi:hypothetical protein